MQNKDIDPFFAPHSINCSTSRVARGGSDNVHFTAGFAEYIGKNIAEKLQGHVFKCQSRTVEKFKDKKITLLDQRGNFRMTEGGIGTLDKYVEMVGRDIADEKLEDFGC